jgi:hypothetical protein
MPYVRTHGNQVAIVHGTRDKATGKVNQRKLFTLYSKVEAAAAIGENNLENSEYFRKLLEDANPEINFNWANLKKEIRGKMKELPDLYPLRQVRSEDALQKALDEFVRQLFLTDPRSPAGRATFNALADDLKILGRFVSSRLEQHGWPAREEDFPVDLHDPFCWRYEVQAREVPDDIEEEAADLIDSLQYKEAKARFELLTRCFPNYAEGFNYLGLIALREESPKDAVEHFRKAMKLGRTLFPKRIPKADYWSDLSTRPYMRGVQNLALALIQAGRFKEALEVCDQLNRECGARGHDAATAHRAAAYLNLHDWQASLDAALDLVAIWPSEGFIAGYALFELGRHQEAVQLFLHASMNKPHTASILLDRKKRKPLNNSEVEDHNGGLELCRLLPRFFLMQSKQSRRFFKKLGENQPLKELLEMAHECTRIHFDHNNRDSNAHHENFQRWHELQSREFAQKKAREIFAAL